MPDWLGSLGKASLKRVIKSGKTHGFSGDEDDIDNNVADVDDDDNRSEDFDPPPRKSVLFKEYTFSVQESIATGLPIIPFVCPDTSSYGERKRKKDAAKRTAEVLSSKKANNIQMNQNPPGTSLEALLRIANEEWMRENSEESSGVLDTSVDTSEASSFASTVKSNLVTLDRKGQQQQQQQHHHLPPSRLAVHPRVLEASRSFESPKSTVSKSSSSITNNAVDSTTTNNNNNNSKRTNVQRSGVVFGPTSHRFIPRRETYPEVMVPYPAPFICRPAQFYAAMPLPQPPAFGLPTRMAVYPESGRVKMVRRAPAPRQAIFQTGDYIDMRQGRLMKSVPIDSDQ